MFETLTHALAQVTGGIISPKDPRLHQPQYTGWTHATAPDGSPLRYDVWYRSPKGTDVPPWIKY